MDPSADLEGEWKEIGELPGPADSEAYFLFSVPDIAYLYFGANTENFWAYVPELSEIWCSVLFDFFPDALNRLTLRKKFAKFWSTTTDRICGYNWIIVGKHYLGVKQNLKQPCSHHVYGHGWVHFQDES